VYKLLRGLNACEFLGYDSGVIKVFSLGRSGDASLGTSRHFEGPCPFVLQLFKFHRLFATTSLMPISVF